METLGSAAVLLMQPPIDPQVKLSPKRGLLKAARNLYRTIFIKPYERIEKECVQVKSILIENYLAENLFKGLRYQDPKRLNKFEYQIFSQNGEDGILEEIFKRIGKKDQWFVELGAGNGMENNTTALLLTKWQGVWLESDTHCVQQAENFFKQLIDDKTLLVKKASVTAENIEQLFGECHVPHEFDLLSIDIDGNDYWVWKAITNYSPRVVVIEYNAILRPPIQWVMRYKPAHRWGRTCYFGASLKSLESLGREKGYALVGCDYRGVNAFFIRLDLVSNFFVEPYTAENHFESPKYFLIHRLGHPRDFGDFESI